MILLCLICFRCLIHATMLHNLVLLNRSVAVIWRRRYHDDVAISEMELLAFDECRPQTCVSRVPGGPPHHRSNSAINWQFSTALHVATGFHTAGTGAAPAARTILGCEFAVMLAAWTVRQCATIYLPSSTTLRVAYRATSPTPQSPARSIRTKTRSLAVAKRPCDCCVGQLVLAKCNWETISCGHYRSKCNHCDVLGLESYRIRRSNAK